MPIEIRELVIRAVVNENGNQQQDTTANSGMSEGEKKQLLQACIDKVMQILKDKKER